MIDQDTVYEHALVSARTRGAMVALAAVAALVLGLFAATPAVALANGTVAGVVTNASGVPIEDVRVSVAQVIQEPGGDYHYGTVVSRWTGADGAYQVPIAPGEYRVYLNADETGVGYVNSWYDHVYSPLDATPIQVTSGTTTPLSPSLSLPGRVGGTVTGRQSLDPSSGGVTLYQATTGRVLVTGTVNPTTGTWGFTNVQAGTYRVAFNRVSGFASSAAQYWNAKAEGVGFAGADVITIASGEQRTGINGALVPGGHLTGRVVDNSGGPLSGCTVQAWTPDDHLVTRVGRTSATGAFDITGLATGDYRVRVLAGGSCDARTQHWTGLPGRLGDSAEAVAVAVQQGTGTAMPADLVYSGLGRIAGHVNLPVGSTADDGDVVVRDAASGSVVGVGHVDPLSGTYVVPGLGSGTYRVTFNRVSGHAFAAPEFYDDTAEAFGEAAATDVDVAFGRTTTVDATLVEGGHITGRLVDEAMDPLACRLQAFTTDGLLVTRTTSSATNGSFDISGLSTGSYLVRVVNYGDCHGGTQFLDGSGGAMTPSLVSANAVSVTRGATKAVPAALIYDLGRSLRNLTRPAVSGTAKVGATLSATHGSWTPSPTSYEYQWLANGAPISGADDPTFVATEAQAGKVLSIRVRARRAGYAGTSATSAGTAPVASTPITNVKAPSIVGTVQVGRKVTAGPGTWSPTGVTLSYAWKAAGRTVGTSRTLVVPASASRKSLTLSVTARRAGATPVTRSTAGRAVKPGRLTQVQAPRIAGTARVGKTLRAMAGTVRPGASLVRYQWFRGSATIKGAVKATYKLTGADAGKTLHVRITYVRSGYGNLVTTSAATKKVAG